MGIYIATFALSISIAFCMLHYKDGIISIANKYDGSRNLLITIMAGMPLFLLSAFRYGIGTDYWTYYDHVRYYDYSVNGMNGEWMYYLLTKFIRQFNLDPKWFFTINAILFVFLTMYIIISRSEMPELSIFLLFGTAYYFASYNIVRQMSACAILLYSVKYIKEQKFIPFLILVIIAAGFHASSYLYILVYFLYKYVKNPFMTMLLAVAIFLLSDIIVNIAISLIELTKYSEFVSSSTDNDLLTKRALVNVAVVAISILYYKYNDDDYKIYYLMQVFATYCVIFYTKIQETTRLAITFSFPVIIFIPMILNNIKDKRTKYLVTTAVVFFYFLYGYLYVTKAGMHEVVPYQTYLGME